jgi:predicted dehydrogenase/threonine dehydrogenase-like Zn-dependent dehydrogenase
MRAILEDMRSGDVGTYDVPQPELRSGGVLIRTAFSAVSSGTERAAVEASEQSLLSRAIARPDLVKEVLDFARVNGMRAAYKKVQTRLSTFISLGYSCSGVVIGVGDGISEFQCGDRVACGGLGYASHCDINWVPRNLAVRIPDSVALDAAALTTIGAIAVQGIRQSKLVFGETVVVIGAGLLGVLTIQLARAAGCRVVAVDLDPSRVENARSLGAQLAMLSSDHNLPRAVEEFSRYGADAAIITAATPSTEPLELAAKLLRERGRIVVVGDVGMGVSRRSIYRKELSIAISRSYGPGRYDPVYEERGHDYPVAYVRWTERRNMESFLDFLASGSVNLSTLLKNRFPVNEGARAYKELLSGRGYTAVLDYGGDESNESPAPVVTSRKRARVPGDLRVGCIGAGGFARGLIFPHLKVSGVSLESVATASGVAAESARRSFGFICAQTPSELLHNQQLDAVFIASRDQSHAPYVIAALQQNKQVFVEKPLCVNRDQLEGIRAAYAGACASGTPPFVMIGFNRRFAPLSLKIQQFFAGRQEPMLAHVRVNAGFIPREAWMQQPSEGGRIIGELCHFVDWARWLVGLPICSISADALPDGSRYNRDNVAASLTFADGSIANLIYVANGDPSVPKEHFEVFCAGSVARLDDFQSAELISNGKVERIRSRKDKGHRSELEATLDAMKSGRGAPIPFEQIIEVSEATFSIAESVATRQRVTAPLKGRSQLDSVPVSPNGNK